MSKASVDGSSRNTRGMRPALDPENREKQMTALAVDLAEKKLRDGTASSQLICHYLDLADSTSKLKRDILEEQKKLLVAKREVLEANKHSEELYEKAIAAMKKYSGHGSDDY